MVMCSESELIIKYHGENKELLLCRELTTRDMHVKRITQSFDAIIKKFEAAVIYCILGLKILSERIARCVQFVVNWKEFYIMLNIDFDQKR